MKSEIIEPQKVDQEMEAFIVRTFADIIRALKAHPEWALELRKLILSADLLELPRKFDEFLEKEFRPLRAKVDKIEEDVTVLKQDVAVLKQDVAVLKQDVAVLKQDVAVLKQDVAVLKQDVAVLKQDVAVLKQEVGVLKADVNSLKGRVGNLEGEMFEVKVHLNVGAFLGKVLKRVKLIHGGDLADTLYEASEKGVITEREADFALGIDVLVSGILRKKQTKEEKEILVAVELSLVGDKGDVERAFKRAEIISKAYSLECIPVVLAKKYTQGAKKLAGKIGVLLI